MGLEYNIYEIVATIAIFAGGLWWWFVAGNKLGLLVLAGAGAYAWFRIIQPLISMA